MAQTFLNLGKEKDIQIQEDHKLSSKMNLKKVALKHIIIKLAKIKDWESLKSNKRTATCLFYKGTSIRLLTIFSTETLLAIREWDDIFKVLKEKSTRQEYSTW